MPPPNQTNFNDILRAKLSPLTNVRMPLPLNQKRITKNQRLETILSFYVQPYGQPGTPKLCYP
jgi:hypothetical protein